MNKFIKLFKLLFLSSLFVAISANANYSSDDFVIEVIVDDGDSFTIRTNSLYEYNYSVDCTNDDSFDGVGLTSEYTCDYIHAGTYTIVIANDFPSFQIDRGDVSKLKYVHQWGTEKWKSMGSAFKGVSSLTINASDKPDLSEALSASNMFNSIDNLIFVNSINDWDVSNIESMYSMFAFTENFNEDISSWDVSSVTDMRNMFYNVTSFNQDIGNWNISNVEMMYSMFEGATSFNQDIGNWNLSSAVDMSEMFINATAFNQDIGDWDVSGVERMNGIFNGAIAFNQDIGNWKPLNISFPGLLADMFANAHLSIGNYDSLLIS